MSDRFRATISGQSSARNTAQLLALTLASREAMDFQVSVKTSATDGAAPNSAGVRLGFRSFTARANTQTTALPGAIMLITGETLIRTGEFRVAKYCGNWRRSQSTANTRQFARFFKNMRRPTDTV